MGKFPQLVPGTFCLWHGYNITGERRVLGPRLSEEAIQGWENWAARHGVTLAALLEAMGLSLLTDKRAFEELPPNLQAIVRHAHEIQRERRRRR